MANAIEQNVIQAARGLAAKLGETLRWCDRDKGFAEWNELVTTLREYDKTLPKAIHPDQSPSPSI